MPLGTDADIQVRVGGPAAMLRLFDRDRNGVADSDLLTSAKAYADARVYAALGASHAGVSFTSPGPVPVLVLDIWCRIVIGYAGEATPGNVGIDGRSPYGGMKQSALADLKALATDNQLRLASGPAAPFATGGAQVSAPPTIYGGTTSDTPGQVLTSGTGGRRTGF